MSLFTTDDVAPYFKTEPVRTQVHLEGNRLVLTCMAEGIQGAPQQQGADQGLAGVQASLPSPPSWLPEPLLCPEGELG